MSNIENIRGDSHCLCSVSLRRVAVDRSEACDRVFLAILTFRLLYLYLTQM